MVARHGQQVVDDPRKVEGLLRDLCCNERPEANMLIAALKEGIPAEMLSSSQTGVPVTLTLSRMYSRLCTNMGMAGDAAAWAVETWALALGVISDPILRSRGIASQPVSASQHPRQPAHPPVIMAPRPAVVVPSRGPAAGAVRINPRDGAEMVYVPAGEFLMGSKDGEAEPAERPQHKVYLDGSWMYKNDVTVAQYRSYCKATKRELPDAPEWGWKDDHPMVNVTWDDAKAYCGWAGASLPTEAQWEKAARGTDGRKYPWGNGWDKTKANSDQSGLEATTPVGSYPIGGSAYGCLDMAGNVFQWCADWYDENYYASSPARNPTGPVTGTYRVLRGGSWSFNSDFCRSAIRYFYSPAYWYDSIGFRCVGPAGLF